MARRREGVAHDLIVCQQVECGAQMDERLRRLERPLCAFVSLRLFYETLFDAVQWPFVFWRKPKPGVRAMDPQSSWG